MVWNDKLLMRLSIINNCYSIIFPKVIEFINLFIYSGNMGSVFFENWHCLDENVTLFYNNSNQTLKIKLKLFF